MVFIPSGNVALMFYPVLNFRIIRRNKILITEGCKVPHIFTWVTCSYIVPHVFTFQNAGERGSSFRSKFFCGGGRKKRPSLPDFPREPEPNKTLDVTNIV